MSNTVLSERIIHYNDKGYCVTFVDIRNDHRYKEKWHPIRLIIDEWENGAPVYTASAFLPISTINENLDDLVNLLYEIMENENLSDLEIASLHLIFDHIEVYREILAPVEGKFLSPLTFCSLCQKVWNLCNL